MTCTHGNWITTDLFVLNSCRILASKGWRVSPHIVPRFYTSVADPWHFWGGSGSFYFRHWPSRCQKKTNVFNTIFTAHDFLKLHLHHFLKIKIQKESQNSRNQSFSYYFCMMIEGSGSGSWRPKNMWIRWIRIQIRIRIRNTVLYYSGAIIVKYVLW